MAPGELTDDQWRRLRPLLPSQKPGTGRPGKDHRTVINGDLVDFTYRRPVAGPARAHWSLGHGSRSFLPLAEARIVGPASG